MINENLEESGKWGVERKRKKKKKRSATSERMRAWESRGVSPPGRSRAAHVSKADREWGSATQGRL